MHDAVTVIGLMSGTSMDGIDVALLSTDGERLTDRGRGLSYPYPLDTRDRVREATKAAWRIWGAHPKSQAPSPEDMALLEAVEREVTELHADAITDFLDAFGISRSEINLIGFHGQTVFHDASRRITRQLGDGPLLAQLARIDVVHDFRSADIAAGGQGAPLVPAYHRAVSDEVGFEKPLAVVNIGGIANVTWIGADGKVIAFDIGPGNCMIDEWMQQEAGLPFDRNGEAALRGTVDKDVLKRLASHPYYRRKPPKSLDRYDLPGLSERELSLEDGAATLVALAAREIAASAEYLPQRPRRWVLAGGGAKNPAIVQAIVEAVSEPVTSADEMGWSAEHFEAEAFGFLAVRALRKLPLTFPSTTGVPRPMTGGRLARAPRR
ncbi:Anhydro-N-acetylmuramic acid kinase [Methyloligella halotolerans]|uniref:Anhydro-N-acetylmuramic acid kinase n=1 Tax=Methyloligella halotolerans TaxID=1177755 RepID=A0A1E2S2S8_9HYPH|nr:anhydro-N-acetylmuramic acid kinase [Methyloligella halotolerans]ODA68823.1 Anhydro-N-acetylmuramic acid kinase [Methyloligella halotolerans]